MASSIQEERLEIFKALRILTAQSSCHGSVSEDCPNIGDYVKLTCHINKGKKIYSAVVIAVTDENTFSVRFLQKSRRMYSFGDHDDEGLITHGLQNIMPGGDLPQRSGQWTTDIIIIAFQCSFYSAVELIDGTLQGNLISFAQYLLDSEVLKRQLGSYADILLEEREQNCFCDSGRMTVRQKFTEVCLFLLGCLKKRLETFSEGISSCERNDTEDVHHDGVPDLPPGTLGVREKQTISAALQFIIVLGLSPYLCPGVGIPISKRLGPGQILLASTHDYTNEIGDTERIQFIYPIVFILTEFISDVLLKDLVLNIHLTDFFTSLLQLRHCAKSVVQQRKSLLLAKGSTPTSGTGTSDLKEAQDASLKTSERNPYLSKNKTDSIHTSSTSILTSVPASENSEEQALSSLSSKSDDICDSIQTFYTIHLSELLYDEKPDLWTLPGIVGFCNVALERSIKQTNVSHVLKTLLMLSGRQKSTSAVKTPPWFRRTVAAILRDVLLEPPNIKNLIVTFIGETSSAGPGAQEWQRCKAVGQIISRCPVTPDNIQHFYSSVSEQLVSILQAPEERMSPLVIRAVGETISELTNQQPELMHRKCLSFLLAPLIDCTLSNTQISSSLHKEVVSESTLASCLETLHRLYVQGQAPQSPFLETLRSVIAVLFHILVFTRKGVSPTKLLCSDLVKAYLAQCSSDEGVTCLRTLVLSGGGSEASHYPVLGDHIELMYGPNGGVQATFILEKSLDVDWWSQAAGTVVDILSDLKSDSLISDMFLYLLQKLTDIVTAEAERTDIILPARVTSPHEREMKLTELQEKITLINLLAMIGEKFGPQAIQSCHQVLLFVKATLERCVRICQSATDDVTFTFEWETVTMAMGLLTAVLGAALELGDDDKKLLDSLQPLLAYICASEDVETTVREMAEDLRVAVATRNLVSIELSRASSKANSQEEKKGQTPSASKQGKIKECTRPLIEVLAEKSSKDDQKEPKSSNIGTRRENTVLSGNASEVKTKLEAALEELCDPLVPVRGHGLISLSRLIDERNAEVIEKRDVLLRVFLENLTHSDSYIYLAAINGLAALSDLSPDQVVPSLTSEFRSNCAKSPNSKSVELTMKVGEAVVKACRRLGELTPKYRDLFLPAMLCGCRHENSLVRASSLSSLGDVCRQLKFAIGPMIHELLTACRDVITSDPDPEPRKAAVTVLTSILQGLGKDSLMALGENLQGIYRTLKHVMISDPDEKVQFQANLALGELDDVMRGVLFPVPCLEKKITILGHR